ncbi:MAG: hypothetical protein A3Q59_03785 [Methanomethylophilus alvi]|nr:MAG: hypothetical protein A3Q59_03785 [Methanomethylophilus alvi]
MNRDDFVYSHVSKFGINDGDWRYLTQSAALKFEMDKKGNVSSIYKGLYVYRDRDSEENILPGETWIVSLTLNPKTESNYFAKGIMRIDARFLFDLEKDQMDEIADAVWNNCRKEIEESFASRFEAEKSKLVEEAVAERTAAYKSQIDEANAKVSSLENKIEEDAQIIDSLKKKQAAPEAAPDAAAAAIPGFESLGRQFPTEIDVMRIGPDTLYSSDFSGRYSAHVSADRRKLLMVPDANGPVICIENMVTIAGLSYMVPYNGQEHKLISKYSPVHGGVLIFIS